MLLAGGNQWRKYRLCLEVDWRINPSQSTVLRRTAYILYASHPEEQAEQSPDLILHRRVCLIFYTRHQVCGNEDHHVSVIPILHIARRYSRAMRVAEDVAE